MPFIDSPIETDPNKSYTLPTLTKNSKGEVVLYWTEKDPQNVVSLCFASSKDGKTYGEKKTVIADAGISSGRLMRPKLLFKKNGEMVAVFSYRTSAAMPPRGERPAAPKQGANAAPAPQQAPQGRPKRSSEIRFSVSKDGGNTWTTPTSTDTDTTKLTRGFFDAVLLANDEIAVAYLKDVKGSTKHEERDLRMAVTKNGVFQDEKLIDAVVCDCCNISMVVDESGALHVVYRDNNNDIRDMSHIVSKDNGATFSSPVTVYADKWEIKGCPHAGATTVSVKNEQYATWFSGTQNGQSGFRLANSSGKLLKVLDASAKNTYITSDDKTAVWVWEQTAESGVSNVFYSKIVNGKLLDSQKVADSDYGQNASTLLFNGKVLVAYEVLKADKKTVLATKIVE
ncbi:MAG: exo-alpha-sialidase [Saprospiraceae bacterium]|nr:exo-alpha-sialidase [Saprospiraceae bacterium]